MSKDPRDENIRWDKDGQAYYKDSGFPVPKRTVDKETGWVTYEGAGVCGLCGSYRCSGNCFK